MAVPGLIPNTASDSEKQVVGEFIIGYAALWLVLTAATESKTTAAAGAAMAVTVAIAATYLYLPQAMVNLGLFQPSQ